MSKTRQHVSGPAWKLLRAAIEVRGFSMAAVADRLGVQRQHVSALCKGAAVPSLDLAISLQELLGIQPRDWVRANAKPKHEALAKPATVRKPKAA